MRKLSLVIVLLALVCSLAADEPVGKPTLVLDTGGHTSPATQVFFTPDGKQLISASTDKTVRVWDTMTGETVQVLRLPVRPEDSSRPSGGIQSAALSPDGKQLAFGGRDVAEDRFYILDLAAGKVAAVIKGINRAPRSLAFAPDGKTLVSGGEFGLVRLWDAKSGEARRSLKGHVGAVHSLAHSPDGKQLASGGQDGIVRVWSLDTGKAREFKGHTGVIHSVAWSADGKSLASWEAEGALFIWNLADGSSRSHSVKGLGYGLAFTPDSKQLLVGDTLLDAATGKQLVQFSRHQTGTRSAALSPDGRWAAWGGFAELYLWDVQDPKAASQQLGEADLRIADLGWRPDGKAVGWRHAALRDEGKKRGAARSFDFAELKLGPAPGKNYQYARTTLGELSLQWKEGESKVAVKKGDAEPVYLSIGDGPKVHASTFLGKDRAAVAGSNGLSLFEVARGQRLRSFQGVATAWAVSPSPDNRYLASGGLDRVIRIFDPDRAEPLLSLYVANNEWIAWTAEGYYAASPGGERRMGWQVEDGADQLAKFLPAAQFRKALYRPDVISRVLETGSVPKALEAADKENEKETKSKPVDVGEILPPRLGPLRLVEQKDSRLRVKAVVESVGKHPVAELQLLLDDRPYAGPDALKSVASPQLGKREEVWTVEIPPGKHRVAIVAANTAGTRAVSESLEVTYSPAKPPEAQPRLRVLAIGINDYPGDMRLDWAVNDAQELAGVLASKSKPLFGGTDSDKNGTNDGIKTRVLTDDRAKRGNILGGLTWLQKELSYQDVAVFFFAGHGYKDPQGRFYLLAHGADPTRLAETTVSGEELKRRLANLPGRVIVMLDACHSGQVSKEQKRGWLVSPRKKQTSSATDELVRQLADDDCGVIVMCAALGSEESLESKEFKHGYFTKALLDGLSGEADRDRKGQIHWTALDYYVVKTVPELTDERQHPATAKPSIRSFPLTRP